MIKNVKTERRLDSPVVNQSFPVASLELLMIRDFIVKKCFESHSSATQYAIHREIMNGNIPPTTTFCITSNTCAGIVLNDSKNNWNLVSGFCLSTDLHPGKNFKKGSFKGDGPWYYDGWLISEDCQRMYGAHWWLESKTHILDFTADQFGHENIVLSSLSDGRYVKFNEFERMSSEIDYERESIELGKAWSEELKTDLNLKSVNCLGIAF
jgi:hypothetical protein